MNFDIAKSALAKGYVDAGLELVEEAALELQFKFRDIQLTIPESEIQDYAEFIASRELFEPVPADCSICSTNYREHLVHSIDRSRILSSVRLGREKEILLGTQDDNNAYVTLGSASQTFINYFRFDEQYVKACKSQLSRRFVLGERSPMLMKRFEYRPTTIRVHNIMASNIPSALKLSSIMIDSSLFGLTYAKGIALRLTDTWPITIGPHIKRPFGTSTRVMGDRLPLPKVVYNSDIVRFYQFGMSTDIPVLQFLSFYQVLEYFFVSTADEHLYTRLASRINDFRFTTTPENLDRLIQDVNEHNTTTDEFEMLKNVISKYVTDDDLITFIEAYEAHLDEKVYTKKRDRFGVELEVKLNPSHVISNTAKVIKVVRNALVHSSDRFDRNARYVPFSESTRIVELEIPLLRFLAEKVIIASAKEYGG